MGRDRSTGTRENNSRMRNNSFLKVYIAMNLVLSQNDYIR